MRSVLSVAAAAALFSSSALAAPWGGPGGPGGPPGFFWNMFNPGKCLTPDTAASIVSQFGSLISAFDANVANSLLADDLVDWSDSINSLAGQPVGGPTFPSKAAFIAGQGAQPAVPFQTLAIEAVTCDTIAFRWLVNLPPEPVKGITILKTSNAQGQKDTWQISTIYTEFNSISWLKDIGGTVTLPQH